MAIATMFKLDGATPNGTNLIIQAVVCFSGAGITYPDVRMIEISIDMSLTPAQILTALAAAIRAQGAVFGYTIPASAVNLISFTKA